MELMETIKNRRSIRHYQDRAIEREKLEAVLEAGRLAPSAKNDQFWHFYAVENSAVRQQLALAAYEQSSAVEAPCILVLTTSTERVMACGQKAGTIDCSIALTYMQLAAVEQGLGTVWLGYFDADAVHLALELSYKETVIALSPIGYPSEQPGAKERKELTEMATII